MKVSKMNQREKKAFYNIKHAANDLLGGLENTLLDYGQDEPEYLYLSVALRLTHDKDKTPDNRLFYRPFSPLLIEIR